MLHLSGHVVLRGEWKSHSKSALKKRPYRILVFPLSCHIQKSSRIHHRTHKYTGCSYYHSHSHRSRLSSVILKQGELNFHEKETKHWNCYFRLAAWSQLRGYDCGVINRQLETWPQTKRMETEFLSVVETPHLIMEKIKASMLRSTLVTWVCCLSSSDRNVVHIQQQHLRQHRWSKPRDAILGFQLYFTGRYASLWHFVKIRCTVEPLSECDRWAVLFTTSQQATLCVN